jgi:hypothetical protein
VYPEVLQELETYGVKIIKGVYLVKTWFKTRLIEMG